MLSVGYMFYEDGKVIGIAVRISNAVEKYKEKSAEDPEFVEVCPENWTEELEGAKICGLPVLVSRSIPKNVIYVGRSLIRNAKSENSTILSELERSGDE